MSTCGSYTKLLEKDSLDSAMGWIAGWGASSQPYPVCDVGEEKHGETKVILKLELLMIFILLRG